jgi:phosphate transport system permease protein
MTATTPVTNTLTAGKMPKAAPWALLAGMLAVFVIGAFILQGDDVNWIGAVILGVIAFVVVNFVIALLIEGRRQAADRLVTSLVTAAFVVALIPLVWLLETVIQYGLGTLLNGTFLTARCATWSARAAGRCTRSSAPSRSPVSPR